MRNFLTIALLLSLGVMFAGLTALVALLPFWAAPLLGAGVTPAVICVVDAIRKMWVLDSGDLVEC